MDGILAWDQSGFKCQPGIDIYILTARKRATMYLLHSKVKGIKKALKEKYLY